MSEYNFPTGAEIIRPGMPVCVYLGGGWCQHPQRGKYFMRDERWWELVPPEPAHKFEWSYAEAERLQKLAHEAIDTYNEYINTKPDTVFLTIFK